MTVAEDGGAHNLMPSGRSQYTVLRANDASTLVDIVNAAMAKGWTPIGGMAVAMIFHDNMVFAQAMTRTT